MEPWLGKIGWKDQRNWNERNVFIRNRETEKGNYGTRNIQEGKENINTSSSSS